MEWCAGMVLFATSSTLCGMPHFVFGHQMSSWGGVSSPASFNQTGSLILANSSHALPLCHTNSGGVRVPAPCDQDLNLHQSKIMGLVLSIFFLGKYPFLYIHPYN
jgi:hypothetical protein